MKMNMHTRNKKNPKPIPRIYNLTMCNTCIQINRGKKMFSVLTFLVLEYSSFQLVPVGSSLDGVRGSVRHFYSEGQGH